MTVHIKHMELFYQLLFKIEFTMHCACIHLCMYLWLVGLCYIFRRKTWGGVVGISSVRSATCSSTQTLPASLAKRVEKQISGTKGDCVPKIPSWAKNTSHQLPSRGEKVNLCHVVLLSATLLAALSQFFSDISCSNCHSADCKCMQKMASHCWKLVLQTCRGSGNLSNSLVELCQQGWRPESDGHRSLHQRGKLSACWPEGGTANRRHTNYHVSCLLLPQADR